MLIYTSTNPSGDATAWSVTDLSPTGPSIHFYDVSCPTTTFCAAVAGDGEIAVSTNPTGGAAAWTVTQLPRPLELRGVSCLSAAFCVAVGDSGTNIRPEATNLGEVVSSTAPLAGAWQEVELPGPHGSLYGVSCPRAGLCLSGDMFGNVVASTSSTSPTAGSSAWTAQNLIPYSTQPLIHNALFSASCPLPTFCAIGATGQVLTSVNPIAPPPAPTPGKVSGKGKGKKGKHRPRPKRPKVELLPSGPPQVLVPHGKAVLQFRFYAKRHLQVRGFVCSFDGQKMRRCRSPRRYRVGAGRHVFRVRAIGWTGLRGPTAVARVQICRHSAVPGTCLKHVPPSRHRA